MAYKIKHAHREIKLDDLDKYGDTEVMIRDERDSSYVVMWLKPYEIAALRDYLNIQIKELQDKGKL